MDVLPPIPRKTGPKQGRRCFTDGEEDRILVNYHAGRSLIELAFLTGASEVTIRNAIKRAAERQPSSVETPAGTNRRAG